MMPQGVSPMDIFPQARRPAQQTPQHGQELGPSQTHADRTLQSGLPPTPQSRPPHTSVSQEHRPKLERVPDVALLYHTAVNSHHAATLHLRQAFIPASVAVPTDPSCPTLSLNTATGIVPYTPDPHAGQKALRLLVLALDLLHVGLVTPGLSDKEKAAFGLEFAQVGLKTLTAADSIKRMRREERAAFGLEIDTNALKDDVESTINKSVSGGTCATT